jgi:hypothetical protein
VEEEAVEELQLVDKEAEVLEVLEDIELQQDFPLPHQLVTPLLSVVVVQVH